MARLPGQDENTGFSSDPPTSNSWFRPLFHQPAGELSGPEIPGRGLWGGRVSPWKASSLNGSRGENPGDRGGGESMRGCETTP